MASRLRGGPAPSPDTLVAIDETNASGAIKVSGRSFVTASNDLYNNIQTTRYNRSRLIRITGYVPQSLSFQVQGITGGLATIGVIVNGTVFASVPITTTNVVPRWYTISGMTAGAKTVDLIEEFQDRTSNPNSGIDGSCSACYVTRVALPSGSGGAIAKMTAQTIIVAFGDSHIDGHGTDSCSVNGWGGQLARAARAAGMAFAYAGAGSSTLCGDGPTAADTAAMIHDLKVQAGATVLKFLMMRRPNDYAYYSPANGPGTFSPTTYGTYLQGVQTALDASDPGWTGIYTRIPQGSSWGANAGGFTLDNYWTSTVTASTANGRTNVQTFDKTVYTSAGLSLANPLHFFEADPGQVHLAPAGHDIVFGVARGFYGL